MDRWMGGWLDRQRWKDRWMDGWRAIQTKIDGQMDDREKDIHRDGKTQRKNDKGANM